MKKLLSVALILCLAASLFSTGALAADMDMAGVLAAVKRVISIPAEYKDFSSNSYESTNGGVSDLVWNFSWRSGENSINVSADSGGRIVSYNKYVYTHYTIARATPAPKLTKDEGQAFAEAFLTKVSPDIAASAAASEGGAGYDLYSGAYTYSFHRVENGIPFFGNNATVSVDYRTGETISFYSNWNFNLTFEEPGEGILTAADADGVFKENLKAELFYATKGGYARSDKKTEAVLIYAIEGTEKAVDPRTGELLSENYEWSQSAPASAASYDKRAMEGGAGGAGGSGNFSEQETAGIAELEKLVGVETLDAALRANAFLPIASGFTLRYKWLGQRYDSKSYMWTLEYSGPAAKEDFNVPGASATFDAKTGELLSFYYYDYQEKSGDGKFDLDYAKSTAAEFLKKAAPLKAGSTVYAESPEYKTMNEGSPDYFSMNFQRVHSGVKYRDDSLSVNVDARTGKVTSYYQGWHDDISFESQEGILTAAEAVDAYMAATGSLLQYQTFTTYFYDTEAVASSPKTSIAPPAASPDYQNSTRLVYMLKNPGSTAVLAKTGELADYGMEPVETASEQGYSDAAGHWVSKTAELLYGIGMKFDGGKLLPDTRITQKEFVVLLSKAVGNYYSMSTDTDSVYDDLISRGIVKKEEKNPGGTITKLQAVKFIIRAAGLEKAAVIKGIYKTSFKDETSIPEADRGYCALAAGLSIAKGDDGRFTPQNLTTRAEALTLLYNFMNT